MCNYKKQRTRSQININAQGWAKSTNSGCLRTLLVLRSHAEYVTAKMIFRMQFKKLTLQTTVQVVHCASLAKGWRATGKTAAATVHCLLQKEFLMRC